MFIFSTLLLLAGPALAFNLSFNNMPMTTADLLNLPPGPWVQECQTECDMASSMVKTCNQADGTCLCTKSIGQAFQSCEQCLFTYIIDKNIQAPPLVGSSPALTAFTSACLKEQNITLTLALTLPPTWDGPQDSILNTPETIFVVGLGAVLGASALYILSAMD